MKIAYFDCSSGIAGNMILSALIDAGLNPDYLIKKLKTLDVGPWTLDIQKTKRHGIACTSLDVIFDKNHGHRNLSDILKIIKKSNLSKHVKKLSATIFRKLAQAEAKVHVTPINKVHFHEVGAIDAIIDIVGCAIGLEKLGIKKVFSSPLPHGTGTIKHAHGILPIPAPATAKLLEGFPIYQLNIKHELVTPTGAAIITTIAENNVHFPKMVLQNTGRGTGSAQFNTLSNLLVIFIGKATLPTQKDTIIQIETNLDDLDPKKYDPAIKKLMQAGALDAWVTPIRMKKKRAAFSLNLMAKPAAKDRLLKLLFEITTSIGARIYLINREKLKRKIKKIKTKYGALGVKVSYWGDEIKNISVEHEDCKKAAQKHKISINKVYREGIKTASLVLPNAR